VGNQAVALRVLDDRVEPGRILRGDSLHRLLVAGDERDDH
jgi:hypothetical protein